MKSASPTTPWRLLRSYLGPQRGSVLAMALLLVTSITLEIAEPLIVARFIESIQLGLAERTLITIALIFLGVAALRQITRVIAAYASERVSWTATNAVREDLSAHVLDLDLTFHESRSPGELIERIDGDVNQVAEFFSSLIVQLVGNALLVLGLIIAMTVVDWRIGLTFAVINVVGFFLLSKVTAKATAKWEDDREQSAQLIGYVSESIRATEDLRSSAATQHAMNRFHQRLRSWLPVKVRAEAWSSTIWIVMSLVFTASTAFAFGYGGFFYQNGEISLANTYLVVAFATMLNTPIEVLREQVQGLQQAKASIRRISEMFGFSSKLADGEKALPAGPLSVEFDHVGFEYAGTGDDGEVERKKVLDDLSFRLEPGTTLGLVGRTGAGKSTIAHLLFRMYDPVHGRVLLDGMDARSLSLSSLRSQCGFVTQDVHVFEATLRENLTFFDPAVPDERLLEILEALELRSWLEGLPDGLSSPISPKAVSSGQAQLINLARVFLKDPGLVILDEPSSKLDLATEAMVERALDRLLAGRTVIIIAHRLDTIRRADQVLVLDRGTVLERGATVDLLADPASHLAALHRVGEVTR